jgi:hypothetical protein
VIEVYGEPDNAMTGAERQAAYRARHQGEAQSRIAELEREVRSLRRKLVALERKS